MMPAWLPELCETCGRQDEVLARLHAVFQHDFASNALFIDGSPVWFDRRLVGRYEESFLHLVTRTDYRTGERLLDPRRAERLAWCGAIVRHCDDPVIRRWRFKEGSGRVHLYVWYEEGDYVVVLEERLMRRGRVYFLVTAYHVDGDATRRRLRAKYEKKEP